MKKMFKLIGVIAYSLAIAFILWIFLSWCNVNKCNSIANDNYKNYASWNIFLLMEGNVND